MKNCGIFWSVSFGMDTTRTIWGIFPALHEIYHSLMCNMPLITNPLKKFMIFQFLGGLSLHLNHLIESRVTNYDWPFGTLPFGLFWSNLDTRDLETYPRTYSGHF